MRVKKFLLFLIIVIFFITSIIVYTNKNNTSKCVINGNAFDLKIADTDSERHRGLKYIKKMSDNNGMLFIFDKDSLYNFWMKDTEIPLDIIWIDSNNKIVDIIENAQPCHQNTCQIYSNQNPAKYVLEINAGLCQKYGIKSGDEVKINFSQKYFK